MSERPRPIAILQGASGAVIQQLLADCAERWGRTARLAGMIEEANRAGPNQLRSVADSERYDLFQPLGAGAACGLDAAGVLSACEAVERDIARGCDLAILSKFGRLEAENRSGLLSAFAAAIAAGVPILTSVSPKWHPAWDSFAAPLYGALPATEAAVEHWWRAVRAPAPGQPLVENPG